MTPGNAPTTTRGWIRRGRWRLAALVAVLVLVLGGVALAGLWQVSGSPRFCSSCHIMLPYVAAWKASNHRDVACIECHYPPGLRDTVRVKFHAITQVAKWATGTYSSKPFAEVEDASCLRSGCHAVAELERTVVTFTGAVRFAHGPHLSAERMGRQLRCSSCHSQIVVEKHFEIATATCFLCHFKGARDGRELAPVAGCTGCHDAPKGDIALGSVTFNHEEMVKRGVACQKCHLNVVEGAGAAPRERCFSCHNQLEKIERYGDTALVHEAHVGAHTIECTRCHDEIKHRLPPPVGAPAAARPGAGRRPAGEVARQ